MPNYSLTVNSTFQPFSYQELAAPVMEMSNYHERLAEEYDKLSSQADVLEAMGANDRDKNSGTYQRYKSYSDRLRQEADNLYKFGLNTESRQRLSDLRRMYNTEIVPIQNAWNRREQESADQMKAQLANPSLMFTRDARSTTLDDYIKNPTGGYGVINGANITAQMSAMAKSLEKQILSGATRREDIDEFTYDHIRKYGLTPDMVRDWRNNPTLSKMFEQVMQANGVTPEALNNSLNAQNIINQSTGYAEMGMWNAVGEDRATQVENYGARLNAQAAKEIAVEQAKQAAKAAAVGNTAGLSDAGAFDDSVYSLPMSGADYSSSKEQEDAMKTLGYVMKDGKLVPTGKAQVKYSKSGASNASFNMGNYKMGDYPERTVNDATKEVSLFNQDGSIKTREQFMKQAGTDPRERKALEEYFNKMVDAGKTLGIYGRIYNQKDLTKQYNTLRDNNAAQMANVRALNYEKSDWNANSKNFAAREIKGYKKGQPVYDTKTISLGELLNKQDSNKKDVNVSAYWSNLNGQEGLVLATSEDGKAHRYFINADNMPESNVRAARQYFSLADTYRDRGMEEEAKQALQIALRALHTGLTIHNKSYEQSMVRQPSLTQQGLVD